MAKVIVANDRERVAKWVAPRVKRSVPFVYYGALGLEEDGELIAGVVFDNYLPNGRVSMHCAGEGKRWLNRAYLYACFDYAFRQLNVNVILNPVDADNEASMRFTKHIGFEELARVPGGAGDCDLVLFILPREKCRWLKESKHEMVTETA